MKRKRQQEQNDRIKWKGKGQEKNFDREMAKRVHNAHAPN